jgi:recombination DNA repair RAD52 pathway protein
MGFSAKQLQALRRSLSSRQVRTREANGRELSYIEGWYAVSEANRIFGFDGWSRETVETRCVLARENRGSFLAVYIAKVPHYRAGRWSNHRSRRPRVGRRSW